MHKYRVLSKGNENSVVMATEPASERGQIMLMKGRDLWIFIPMYPSLFVYHYPSVSLAKSPMATLHAQIFPAITTQRFYAQNY